MLDPELQPRAEIDRAVLENYVQLLVDGTQFPPVIVFRDAKASVLWLADGFHRWHAHKVIDADSIAVDIRDGTRRDALLYSLSANAKHGLQRGAADYKRAYEAACRNNLVEPSDSDAVATLLRCSGSWADKLTAKAREPIIAEREAARVERNAEIIRLKDEGKSNREVASEVGLSHVGVAKVLSGNQQDTANSYHTAPFLSDAAKAKLRELDSPAAENWSAALRALRLVNEQVPVDVLFADRFARFDHVFGRRRARTAAGEFAPAPLGGKEVVQLGVEAERRSDGHGCRSPCPDLVDHDRSMALCCMPRSAYGASVVSRGSSTGPPTVK
jgi:hypothetical protein